MQHLISKRLSQLTIPWHCMSKTTVSLPSCCFLAFLLPAPLLTETLLQPLPSVLQHVCAYACSEEVPEPVDVGGSGFCVAFDPLDGSSIVDTNFSVGTIFGVWPGDKLKDITGREQVSQNGTYKARGSGITFGE